MADRTVSVRLRAQVGDFVAEMNIAGNAVDGFSKKVDGASKKTDDSLKKSTDNTKRSSQQLSDYYGSIGVAAAGLAGPVGAAGIAFVTMAAVAVPSIAKVVKAQANLGLNWDTLDKQQKVSAAGVASLVTEYKALAKSYEPTALTQFNGVVATAHSLMPQLAATLASTRQGVVAFGDSVDASIGREVPRILSVVRGNATPALNELGTTFGETAHLAGTLVQDLAPVGMTLLHSTNGVLGLANALTSIDPHLTEFAAVAYGLKAPVTGLTGLVTNLKGRFGGVGTEAEGAAKSTATFAVSADGVATKIGKVGVASKLAALSTKAFNAATSVGPGLYVAAGAALVYLAARMSSVRTQTDGMIDRLKGEYQAFGNNLAGYRQYATAIGQIAAKQRAAYEQLKQSMPSGPTGFRISNPGGQLPEPDSLLKLEKAYKAAQQAQTNITQGAAELGKEFGVTSSKAIELANAAGVDMSRGILKSGELTTDARAKITQYEAAVQAASDPTKRVAEDMQQAANSGLLMKDRVAALTDALSAYYGPASAAWNATTALKQGMDDLEKAMRKARGDFSGNTAASRALRTALDQQLTTVSALYQANLQTKGYTAARNAANNQLQVMYALAGRSKDARGQIDALANSLGLSVGKSNMSRSAFIAAARAMGNTTAEAERLWAAYNKLPAAKNTKISTNADAAAEAVRRFKAMVDALHGKTVTINEIIHATTLSNSQLIGRTSGPGRNARGGPIRRAAGGPSGWVSGPGTATSDSIPALLSNGEYVIRATQARKYKGLLEAINGGMHGFAGGGLVGYATGGSVTPLSLSDVLQHWSDVMAPASKSDVDKALKSRRDAVNRLRSAEDSLYKAEHARHRNARTIAADERRVAAARQDLASVTSRLSSVEKRYQYGKLSPASQLSAALVLGIRDNATFIKNLQTLASRGAGDLAQKLLAMSNPEAEKIAASAVTLSSKNLAALQGKVTQEQQQTAYLAQLPNILSVRSAIAKTKGGISSWVALLNATGLDPASLADAVKLMTGDLSKTASGRALLADMHAHGYQAGGEITGRPGTDANLIRATAGEFMVRKGPAAKYRPLLNALNSDNLGAFVRHLVSGAAGVRTVAAAAPVGAAGPTIHQTFPTQEMDTHQLAREVARETAWALFA